MTTPTTPDPLAPVRAALLARARADAARILAEAEADAAATLARAGARAGEILATARAQGAAEATESVAEQGVAARRASRAAVLAARSEAYRELSRRAVDAVCALREQPDYPRLRAALEAHARAMLGPDARISEDPRGGITARAGGRRLDCTLTAYAVRALNQVGGEVQELWTR